MIKKPLSKQDRVYVLLQKQLDDARQDLDQAHKELVDARSTIAVMTREKARRTDQFRALLQAINLVLAVASNEMIDLRKFER